MKNATLGRTWLPLALLALSSAATSTPARTPEAIVLSVEQAEGTAGSRVTVPIVVEDAERLGPVQFVLKYDPAVLRVEDVGRGSLARAAMVHHELPEPGTLRVALITEGAMDGDGNLVDVEFEVLASNQISRLELENARAWEWQSLAELIVDTRAGTFVATGPLWTSRTGLAVAGLFVMVIVVLLAGRRRRVSAAHASG